MVGKRGGRFYVKVYVGKGRTRWLGTFAKERDARKAERTALDALRPKGTETCATFADRWLHDYPRPAPGTARTYRYAARRFGQEFGDLPLVDVDRPKAREWALGAPGSVVAAVRAMFSDALNDGLVVANPFAGLRLKRSRGRKDIRPPTEEQVQALADAARTEYPSWPDFAALILTAAYTGMRAGELCVLERGDLAGTEIHVRRALDRTGQVGPPKNGKARTITCPPKAQQALHSVPPLLGSDLVFHSPRGKRLSVGTINYHFRLIRSRGLDFHELRHACATIFLERGATPADVALQLGHTDGGRLVMDLYGHPSEEAARARLRGAFAKAEPIASVATRAQRKAKGR